MPINFDTLQFQHPFRKYQTLILDQVQAKWATDHKFHIVAPPGAGKTIVGLELICRFGQPAVVFAPTATIQAQWQEKVGLFLKDDQDRDHWVGTDPAQLKPINIFTYQLLSTPGVPVDLLREQAEADWLEALVREGKSDDEANARARVLRLKENNPAAYDSEIRKRYKRRKREALRDSDFDSIQLLHPNSRALIDDLVNFGIRTVVLDECHHLLDYWALVLKELIRRIPAVSIVGLTATLPGLDSEDETENYLGLLGEVDFEVPTPAVVKEGSLAPYRDLVFFCEPTRREMEYLNDIQSAFERALHAITDSDRFAQWVAATLLYQSPELWTTFLQSQPALAVAGIKYLKLTQQSIPADLPLLAEMDTPITLDDWAVLLEPFGLNVLKVSNDSPDHQLLADLEKSLAPFGLSLTERGLRQGRAPGDLVLALSESKDAATVKILQAEQKALGAQLRAVVITDYEKLSARARKLKDVLDPDAGSAVRLFRALVADAELNDLDAVLVTGTTVLLDSDHGEGLLNTMRQWLAERNLQATIDFAVTDEEKIMALTGVGRDWSSRTYVQLLTAMFEQGFTRCLVGTRGIFGEGWDALGLNTLIDLTAVTTSTGVNQLRGRTLRLDPAWDRKVAHNWDVVCVARTFERGNVDLIRFERKHAQYWGVMPLAAQPDGVAAGQIVKGLAHVDADLAFDLTTRPFTEINYDRLNRQMLTQATAQSRVASYDLWGIGQPYANQTEQVTLLETKEIKFPTAQAIIQAFGRLWREYFLTWLVLTLVVCACPASLLLWPFTGWAALLVYLPLVLVSIPFLIFSLARAYQTYKQTILTVPPTSVVLDIGRAVLAGLREGGLVNANLTEAQVGVRVMAADTCEVFVTGASPAESATFSQALQQIFAPLREPRYLVTRDLSILPDPTWQPLWNLTRRFLKPDLPEMGYHAVPDVLAANKQRAEAFAVHWRHYVGGGELIYTKTESGRKILTHAHTQPRPRVKQMAFEIWK